MITSNNGLQLIKEFEPLNLKACLCPAKKWVIGYGHESHVRSNDEITERQAERFLKGDLIRVEQDVLRLVKVCISQNQFDALVSFVFNCGTRALSSSRLLIKLNQKDYSGAADEFQFWTKVNDSSLSSLIRRRKLEERLFTS